MLIRILLLGLVFCESVLAATPVLILPDQEQYSLADKIEMIEDAAGDYTFEQISSQAMADRFTSVDLSDGLDVSKASASTIYWFRLSVHNSTSQAQPLLFNVIPSITDKVALFTPDNTGKYKKLIAGWEYSVSQRSQRRFGNKFEFALPPQQISTIYLKIKPNRNYRLAFELWASPIYSFYQEREHLLYGLFFGAMLVMFFYNLFIFLSLRDVAYFYYIVYVLLMALALFTSTSFTRFYLWPYEDALLLSKISFAMNFLVIMFAGLFTRALLEIPVNMPKANRIAECFIVIVGLCLPLPFFIELNTGLLLIGVIDLAAVFLVLTVGFIGWREGIPAAKYFLLAWIVLLLGILISVLPIFGVVHRNFITENLPLLGALLEIILLSFALADRINTIKGIAFQAQRQALEEAQMKQKVIEDNLKLSQDNARLGAEVDVARKLQQMVLPQEAEVKRLQGLDISCYMQPADEVGGDYYDVLHYGSKAMICIGDVTGHGLESGVLALMAQTAIRLLAFQQIHEPRIFFENLNQILYDNLRRMGIDKNMTLLMMDYEDGKIRLSGQHEEVLVIRKNGEIERVDTFELGFMLGVTSDIKEFVKYTEIQLAPADCLVLYTDGITEATNDEKQYYGVERLCEVIKANRADNADIIKQAVVDDVLHYIGEKPLNDDITLLVAKQKELETTLTPEEIT